MKRHPWSKDQNIRVFCQKLNKNRLCKIGVIAPGLTSKGARRGVGSTLPWPETKSFSFYSLIFRVIANLLFVFCRTAWQGRAIAHDVNVGREWLKNPGRYQGKQHAANERGKQSDCTGGWERWEEKWPGRQQERQDSHGWREAQGNRGTERVRLRSKWWLLHAQATIDLHDRWFDQGLGLVPWGTGAI